jgi:hypothetical protein
MKLISHRGNISGPIPDKENRPSYIDSAIQLGYDVEVDLRFVNGEFWLGHDYPEYKIEIGWMELRKNYLWFHCKDLDSSIELLNHDFMFFCHQSDEFVLTSNNYIWVHNLNYKINNKCIIPLLTKEDILSYPNLTTYGICTDYITECKKIYHNE